MPEDVIQVGTARSTADDHSDQTLESIEEFDPATVMDDLRAELAQDVSVEPIALNVPNRPNFNVVFQPFIDFDKLKKWTKACKEGRKPDAPVDQLKLCCIVLAETCVGLQYKPRGAKEYREMLDEGDPLTFKSKKLSTMLGVVMGGYQGTIAKMYGSDGHILYVAKIVLDAAGYGDYDLDLEDGGGDPLEN